MRVFKGILVSILVLVLVGGCSFGMGLVNLELKEFFGTREANVEHEIFKENKAHVEGMIDDLAKYKYEYVTADDDTEKEAIANLIRSRFANFDIKEIEDADLYVFLKTIRKGEKY